MSDNNQMVPRNEAGIERIKHYIFSVEVKERFEDMMGKGASRYLNQIMTVVAQSNKLQECSPKSILVSAMRAASLRLSLDPAQGQAWIVPYKGQATFQIGWKGIYALAMRTHQYRYLNAFPVFEGEEFVENRMTGIHKLSGTRESGKVIGWGMAFELFDGFSKTYYMTVEEIAAHAERYSQSYKYPNSPWNDPVERPKMEKKTVLSAGLRMFGVFTDDDKSTLDEIEDETEWHDVSDIPDEDAVHDPELVKLQDGASRIEALGYADPEPEKAPEPARVDGYLVSTIAKLVEDHKRAADDVLKILKGAKAVNSNSDAASVSAWFGKYVELRKANNKHADAAAGADKFTWDLEKLVAEQSSFIDPEVGQP